MNSRTLCCLESGIKCFPFDVDRSDVLLIVAAFHKGILRTQYDERVIDLASFHDSGAQLIAFHFLEVLYWSTSIWHVDPLSDVLD